MADANHNSNRLAVDNRFSIIPHWVILSTISDGALRLYAVLMKYADGQTGTAFPSRSTLARDIRKSPDTVDRYIKELEKVGALRVRRRVKDSKENWSNLYTVVTANPRGAASMRPPTRMDAAENYTHLATPTSVLAQATPTPDVPDVSAQATPPPASSRQTDRRRQVTLMQQALTEMTAWPDNGEDAMDALEEELGRQVGNDLLNGGIGGWLLGIAQRSGGGRYGAGAALNAYLGWIGNQPF